MELHLPHWHNPHIGEYRWPVSEIAAIVVYLQVQLSEQFAMPAKVPVFTLELTLLLGLFISNPKRIAWTAMQWSHLKSTTLRTETGLTLLCSNEEPEHHRWQAAESDCKLAARGQ